MPPRLFGVRRRPPLPAPGVLSRAVGALLLPVACLPLAPRASPGVAIRLRPADLALPPVLGRANNPAAASSLVLSDASFSRYAAISACSEGRGVQTRAIQKKACLQHAPRRNYNSSSHSHIRSRVPRINYNNSSRRASMLSFRAFSFSLFSARVSPASFTEKNIGPCAREIPR